MSRRRPPRASAAARPTPSQDTIAAPATPPGRSAIAVVRISGPDAVRVALGRLRPPPALGDRRPIVARLVDESERELDRVLVTLYQAPASYTGEDVVEISCHGSPILARKLLEVCLSEGARLAEPGEFTQRAFLNGKVDLAQAEAVRDLIESRTGFQARKAAEQLGGRLTRALQPIRDRLVRVISHMETSLEFVEDDVEPDAREALLLKLSAVDQDLAALEESHRFGRPLQEGVTAAIVGKPNAGKSSLFNALLKSDRAIVTEIPGTTRDSLSETAEIGGIPFLLIDTAGIRQTSETVERLGVERSRQAMQEADIALFVLDGSRPLDEEDEAIWREIKDRPAVLAVNKSDLPQRCGLPRAWIQRAAAAEVSALKGTRLDFLREALREAAAPGSGVETEGVIITSVRHCRCLQKARAALGRGRQAYAAGLSEEFPLYDLRKALAAVGEITGETTAEEILGEIFSNFCIGK